MPHDVPGDYNQSNFRRIQDVMLIGGFHSRDLG